MEILILGRGKSAKSLYNVLSKENNVTYAIEDNELIDEKSLYKKDVDIDKYDYFYLSPGVKNDDILYQKLLKNHKKISTEIEYSLEKLKNHKIIAITGSNGKTTIASLLHYVLDKKKVKNVVCGNIGDPLVNYIDVSLDTIIILEISSFQLERLKYFKPYISLITNITPNHLDRNTFEEYIFIKKKVYMNQDEKDFFITNKETAKIYSFDPKSNFIISKRLRLKSKYLIGNHNYDNFGFIRAIMKILNIKGYKRYLKEFKGVKYRLEYLGKYKRTLIYNDAKSTTIYSTLEAIKTVGTNTLLILGGRNKNIDYSIIKEYKIKKIIMYGEETKFNKDENIEKFKNLKDAFNYVKNHINEFRVVLYSPGFTSFDLYNNYLERGEEFEKLCYDTFKIK